MNYNCILSTINLEHIPQTCHFQTVNPLMLLQVLADLVQGEFMQLGSKENENERFAHYLKKTFKKTASLLAYSCKAVCIQS